ncbi:hypothetical protein B0O80DRAFT_88355 [Mortierella sp. GBAus27b]|nr:hypothetical protein B0O80DRAFT_88355 [Mortierella sp. GBAus27b]
MTERCSLSSCGKTAAEAGVALKRCAKCKTVLYCSRDCQKTDWKTHKATCATHANAAVSATATSIHVDKPFHKLHARTWLHSRPEADVYKLLLDTFRLRMEDESQFEGLTHSGTIYTGNPDNRNVFEQFLRLAESRAGLLPPWWNAEKASECVNVNMENGGLRAKLDKAGVIKVYSNSMMPMQLRVLGEQVYQRALGGMTSDSMVAMQMQVEAGSLFSSTIDSTKYGL